MTLQQAFEDFARTLVADQTATWEPKVAAAIPGLAGVLLREVLALPPVQAEITKLEAAGVHWFADEACAAYGRAKAYVLGHLHGRAQQLAQQVLNAQLPVLHLDESDVVALAKLIEAGKLKEALEDALKKFVPAAAAA